MALALADRVQETTTTTGTGSVTLLGAVTGFQSFAVVGNGNTTYYTIADQGGANWEVGIGTYSTTGPTLARTTVLASSNSGSLVNFTSGTKSVWVAYPAEKAVYLDASGNASALGTVSSGVWQGTAVGVGYGGTGATSAGISAFNNITGYTASGATGTTSTNLVFSTSPTLTTPNIGAATATSVTIGSLSYTPANALLTAQSSATSYNQVIIANTNNVSTSASTDFIVNNYNSTDSTYYGDFGMNGSAFSGSGAFNQANNVYLTSTSADLAIGTTTANSIHFVINGSATDAATINTNGAVAFNGSYGTSGYLLQTNGSASAPTWVAQSSVAAGSVANALTAGTGITYSSGTTYNGSAAITISIPQAIDTTSSVQFGSFGVGTAASGTSGEIRATNNVTAYYSDKRLKTKIGDIQDALGKVGQIETMLYHANETAVELGYDASVIEVGVTAQSVQAVQPEAVAPAPIDEKYLTVRYERLVPLLIEAIKELTEKVNALEAKG